MCDLEVWGGLGDVSYGHQSAALLVGKEQALQDDAIVQVIVKIYDSMRPRGRG